MKKIIAISLALTASACKKAAQTAADARSGDTAQAVNEAAKE